MRSIKECDIGEILEYVQPCDLLKFGLIPEFVGRLPVVATLHDLKKDMLIKILVEPKNSLIKQYQRLFAFEKVNLRFTEDALHAIAAKATELQTGARGLRAIMESSMLDIMYELPSLTTNIEECVINKDTILHGIDPIFVYEKAS